jgi:peptide/nickel transport system substrate-binding protein
MRALAIALLLLTVPATPQMPLRIVQSQDFNSLDPVFVSGVGGQELAALFYSYLLRIDDRGELAPDVAAAVPTIANGGIGDGGRQITYRLRPGVRFSDGTALTSADVVATIRAIASPESDAPSRAGFREVTSVRAEGPLRVVVNLAHPYAPILTYLCAPGNAVPILPARFVRGRLSAGPLDSQPLGSGPYQLASWVRGDHLSLIANQRYFRGVPAIREITIRIVPETMTAFSMLRSGEADAFVNADDTQFAMLASLPQKRVSLTRLDGTGALFFNTRSRALEDPSIRRAIGQSLNVSEIITKTMLSSDRAMDPGRGLFQWAYDPRAFAMPRYNARAAAQAVSGKHLALDLIARADRPTGIALATQIQEQAQAVGVTINIRRIDVTQLTAPHGPLYSGNYDLALFPFINGFDPDVSDQFACDRIPPRGFNKPRYCNHHLDALMTRATLTYDRRTRIALYREIQRILARDLPMLAMYQGASINVFPIGLRNQTNAITTPFWNVGAWKLDR